ncbi:MAG: chromate transporter [Clostridia bacterium]|nr:chromate transporter [Clostridia bacterium]
MIYLELFLTFLKIGAFAFGGGYGMIPVIRQEVLAHGWIDDETLLEFIAVSESTPGPISVNLATFVGSKMGGALGAALATLGTVLPAFIVMLIVAKVFNRYKSNKLVNAAFGGIRPTVTGMILATGTVLLVKSIFPLLLSAAKLAADGKAIIIAVILAAEIIAYKKVKQKNLSPAMIIISSAVLGIILY